MGQVIKLVREEKRNDHVIKALRVLLHKAKTGELRGIAFVALKQTGPCAGIINIHDNIEAIEAASSLIDALRGDRSFLIPIDS